MTSLYIVILSYTLIKERRIDRLFVFDVLLRFASLGGKAIRGYKSIATNFN